MPRPREVRALPPFVKRALKNTGDRPNIFTHIHRMLTNDVTWYDNTLTTKIYIRWWEFVLFYSRALNVWHPDIIFRRWVLMTRPTWTEQPITLGRRSPMIKLLVEHWVNPSNTVQTVPAQRTNSPIGFNPEDPANEVCVRHVWGSTHITWNVKAYQQIFIELANSPATEYPTAPH